VGIDFIRGDSGKPYVKRWAKGADRAKTPGLFDVRLGEDHRAVTATLLPDCAPKPGSSVIVQSTGTGEVVVFEGLREVGRVADPPPYVTAKLETQHGMAAGVVERLGAFGTAEIAVK
jgi:hypothetical protein